jgi:hypothetical protein
MADRPVRPCSIAWMLGGFGVVGGVEAYQLAGGGSLALDPAALVASIIAGLVGLALTGVGLRALRKDRGARRRGIPWRLVQLVASATISIGGWIGLHWRWVRRRFGVLWALALVAATGALVGSTVVLEKGDRVRPPFRWPTLSLALWAGGTVSCGGAILIAGSVGPTPVELAAPVGGLVVLLVGSYVHALRTEPAARRSFAARACGWLAFGWSLGVGLFAGVALGPATVPLLRDLVASSSLSPTTVAPCVRSLAWLLGSYALLTLAYAPSVRLEMVDLHSRTDRSSASVHGGINLRIPVSDSTSSERKA